MIPMGKPPAGRDRELLVSKAMRILGAQEKPSRDQVNQLILDYALYRAEEEKSMMLPAEAAKARDGWAKLEAVANMSATELFGDYRATDGESQVSANLLDEHFAQQQRRLIPVQQAAREILDKRGTPRQLEGNENRTVATDTHGSPEKRLLRGCKASLVAAAQPVSNGRKGNVKDLARTIIKIWTGNDPSLAGTKLA